MEEEKKYIYNDKADQLAKSALMDRKKVAVQGEHICGSAWQIRIW